MMATTPPINYADLAKKHGSIHSIAPDASSMPPELQRIQKAVGAQLVQGQPYGDAIATVNDHEPHKIEINDMERFRQGAAQTLGHELTHLLMSNLSGKTQSQIPVDSKTKPYDISGVDDLRKQGKKIWQIPQEQAATIVQTYVADPAQRARLGPWIQDLNNAPLSLVQPTSPQDKNINIKPRMPVPPIQAWQNTAELMAQAAKMNGRTVTK